MKLAEKKGAGTALFWVAFIESSFFPIPPDVMLMPMVLARRAMAWIYAAVCTAGSVLGGIAGYAIGYFFFDLIGQRENAGKLAHEPSFITRLLCSSTPCHAS